MVTAIEVVSFCRAAFYEILRNYLVESFLQSQSRKMVDLNRGGAASCKTISQRMTGYPHLDNLSTNG